MTKSKSKYTKKYPKFKPAQAWIKMRLWTEENLLKLENQNELDYRNGHPFNVSAYTMRSHLRQLKDKMEELEVKT